MVSTTERPVTQVAEVAVNRASRGLVKVPPAEDTGSVRSRVPAVISSTKLTTITLTGAALFLTVLSVRLVKYVNSPARLSKQNQIIYPALAISLLRPVFSMAIIKGTPRA